MFLDEEESEESYSSSSEEDNEASKYTIQKTPGFKKFFCIVNKIRTQSGDLGYSVRIRDEESEENMTENLKRTLKNPKFQFNVNEKTGKFHREINIKSRVKF